MDQLETSYHGPKLVLFFSAPFNSIYPFHKKIWQKQRDES